MEFNPKDADTAGCLEPGVYDFTVKKAEDTQSKSGNEMVALWLTVMRDDGVAVEVRDWLLPNDRGIIKIKKFCESVGLADRFAAGQFSADDCNGRSGFVRLKIEQDDDYGPQNRVAGYTGSPHSEPVKQPKKSSASAKSTQSASGGQTTAMAVEEGDEIPF